MQISLSKTMAIYGERIEMTLMCKLQQEVWAQTAAEQWRALETPHLHPVSIQLSRFVC